MRPFPMRSRLLAYFSRPPFEVPPIRRKALLQRQLAALPTPHPPPPVTPPRVARSRLDMLDFGAAGGCLNRRSCLLRPSIR